MCIPTGISRCQVGYLPVEQIVQDVRFHNRVAQVVDVYNTKSAIKRKRSISEVEDGLSFDHKGIDKHLSGLFSGRSCEET